MLLAANDQTTSIAGGFVLVPVSQIIHAWNACRKKPLGIHHFRAWLAAREVLARRQDAHERIPNYTAAELAKLLDLSEKRVRATLHALQKAGLLNWSQSAISFPDPIQNPQTSLLDSIGKGQGNLAIPRRILRLLCKSSKPALIAAAIAILCRCLSRRKSGFASNGRIKASWIAKHFAISLRQAKAARTQLTKIGWIESQPSETWAERKWGRIYRINLQWDHDPAADGSTLTPQPPQAGATLTPPDLQTRNPSRTNQNQDPASPGPTGARLAEKGSHTPTPGPPRLDDVKVEDLRDDGRLLELHRQAVARQLLSPSEADRLRFAAAAEHALALGKQNPCGLFAYLVRGQRWRYLTQGDEDSAQKRLRRHLWGGSRPGDGLVAAGPSRGLLERGFGLSEDAMLVSEVRKAVIRAGYYQDPWPMFASRRPDWDRGRWDRALVELGFA
jgi:hypothetical protein